MCDVMTLIAPSLIFNLRVFVFLSQAARNVDRCQNKRPRLPCPARRIPRAFITALLENVQRPIRLDKNTYLLWYVKIHLKKISLRQFEFHSLTFVLIYCFNRETRQSQCRRLRTYYVVQRKIYISWKCIYFYIFIRKKDKRNQIPV